MSVKSITFHVPFSYMFSINCTMSYLYIQKMELKLFPLALDWLCTYKCYLNPVRVQWENLKVSYVCEEMRYNERAI